MNQKSYWKRGSASIMLLFVFLVIATGAIMVILQYSNIYSATRHAQMISDIISDGAVAGANNGWTVVYDGDDYKGQTVKKCAEYLSINNKKTDTSDKEDLFLLNQTADPDPISYSIKTGSEESKSSYGIKRAFYTIRQEKVENTVNAKTKVEVESVSSSITKKRYIAEREATTHLTGATAGMRIVLFAYSFCDKAMGSRYENSFNDPVTDVCKIGATAKTRRTQYVWGGGRGGVDDTSWMQYTDCSGFVSGVYKHFTDESGKPYFFTAYTGVLQNVGELIYSGPSSGIDYSMLQPADIICYWWQGQNGDSNHVGIYCGNGYQIDCRGGTKNLSAASAGPGATFRKVPNASYVVVRRIIKDSGSQHSDEKKYYQNIQEGPGAAYAIYSALIDYGFTSYQAAGIIGCMGFESGGQSDDYKPYIVQGQSISFSKAYTEKIDKGIISREAFIRDGIGGGGYGTPQWTGYLEDGTEISPGRKALLYDTWTEMGGINSGISIGSTEAAIAAILKEFSTTHAFARDKIMATSNAADAAEACYHYYEGMNTDNGTLGGRRDLAERLDRKYNKQNASSTYDSKTPDSFGRIIKKAKVNKTATGADSNSYINYDAQAKYAASTVQPMHYMGRLKNNLKIKKSDGTTISLKAGASLDLSKKGDDFVIHFNDGTTAEISSKNISITKLCFNKQAKYSKSVAEAWVNTTKKITSKTNQLFWCSKYTQKVYIFERPDKKSPWVLVKTFNCNTGHATSGGDATFNSFSNEIYNKGNTTQKYAQSSDTSWMGPSGLQQLNMHYSSPSGNSIHVGPINLDTPSSGGCIRLSQSAASWCYDNLKMGTRVVVY